MLLISNFYLLHGTYLLTSSAAADSGKIRLWCGHPIGLEFVWSKKSSSGAKQPATYQEHMITCVCDVTDLYFLRSNIQASSFVQNF